MRRIKSVGDVIQNLKDRQDARVYWWERIAKYIQLGDYTSALRALVDHHDDCDYQDQVHIICAEIARSCEERGWRRESTEILRSFCTPGVGDEVI